MEPSDFEIREGYAVLRHPEFPGVEIRVLGDATNETNEVQGIEIYGATEEQLPLVLEFVKELAPGMKPEIIL
ncbi:MAG: hypothetical protein ACREJX_09175 [Polyangiaceae bacterium]